MRTYWYTTVVGLALLWQASPPALAGLGGSVDSVQTDGAHLKAQVKDATSGAGYSVQELDLPSGTVVNEYLSPSGMVFGVSWHGPTIPNLSQIFGSYFQQYAAAAQAAPHNAGTRRHFQVSASDLVVQSNARMRSYIGRAYVPSLLPPNVTAAVIQ